MKNKAYRAIAVNQIQLDRLLQRHEALVHVGLDVGKDYILGVLRWANHYFERPWRCRIVGTTGTHRRHRPAGQ